MTSAPPGLVAELRRLILPSVTIAPRKGRRTSSIRQGMVRKSSSASRLMSWTTMRRGNVSASAGRHANRLPWMPVTTKRPMTGGAPRRDRGEVPLVEIRGILD